MPLSGTRIERRFACCRRRSWANDSLHFLFERNDAWSGGLLVVPQMHGAACQTRPNRAGWLTTQSLSDRSPTSNSLLAGRECPPKVRPGKLGTVLHRRTDVQAQVVTPWFQP